MAIKLVRFDWVMKKMLLDKANIDILEGIATWSESLTHTKPILAATSPTPPFSVTIKA